LPARGQYRVHRAKGRRVEYDETSRFEHGGYIESPAKMLKAYEEAVERNKRKLAYSAAVKPTRSAYGARGKRAVL
jgi:hypothetical protein